MKAGVVIPITGDAPLIGDVVRAAFRSKYVATVIAVAHESAKRDQVLPDEHPSSRSGVAEAVHRAALAGARISYAEEPGRGALVATGLDVLDTEAVMFLDADLRGLITHHVDLLAWPVAEGHVGMSCGLLDSGALLNQVFRYWLPVLTRQRCIKSELAAAVDPVAIEAGNFESELGHLVDRGSIPTHTVVLEGVWQSPAFSANSRFGPIVGTFARILQYAGYPIGLRMPSLPNIELPRSKHEKSTGVA